MKYVGYHRTSTKEQNPDRGIRALNDFSKQRGIKIKKIYVDQATGKNFNRPQYKIMRDEVLDEGDVLIISELDRLGRNKEDTLKELKYFKEHGIRIMILELPTTLMEEGEQDNKLYKSMVEIVTNLMIEMLAAQAETELAKMKKRQKEGLDTLREKGEWYKLGRPRVMKQEEFNREYQKVEKGEVAPYELMRRLNLKRSTYYLYRRNYKAEGKIGGGNQ